jgi:DNA-binding winged helix-turn-helix (wHTH) protein
MLVSPARRLVEGPGGHAHLEPLIMQVFLLLLDAGGKVVTRNELFDQCWGGVVVGDDSLNRAIAKVRRTGAHVAPGLFEIETIPRTGYRLTGKILDLSEQDGITTIVCTLTFVSKEAREGAVSTGMTDGMEHSYTRLDDLVKAVA